MRTVLALKLFRDIWRSKWQYLAVAAMVVLGVAFFNAAYACYVNLTASYDSSYRKLSFEDFGIKMQSAPRRVAERLLSIPGIKNVEGRLVEDVAVELPNRRTKKLVGRLISIPVRRDLTVNQLKIVEGGPIRSYSAREVLLEASFARHHRLKPGDFVIAQRGDSEVKLKIAGIVQSVEYLYVVQSKQDLVAFPDTFGVMFVPEEVLGGLVRKPDQINEIRVTTWPSASLTATMRASLQRLQAYRPDEPVPRTEQPSYQMLDQDVKGFQTYAILFPAFFLSVAGLAVYALLNRMVHQQRPVIGLLRSLGFSRPSIILHYVVGAFLIGLIGSILGSLAGIWLAEWTSRAYMSQLQVPFEEIWPRWDVLIGGMAIGISACGIAGILPARFAASVSPAEAMRAETTTFSPALALDRVLPIRSLLWRIPIRNVLRQPRRTLSTLFGVVAGMTLMVLARGLLDSSEASINELVAGTYNYDLRLSLVQPRSHGLVNTVRSWPGVSWAEGELDIPVEMRHGDYEYSGLLTGMERESQFRTLVDDRGDPVPLTKEGAIFGPTLRKRLHLEVGDLVEMSIPEDLGPEEPRKRLIRVAGFNDESVGTVAYVPLETAGLLFRHDLNLPPGGVTSLSVMTEAGHSSSVRQRLTQLAGAGSVVTVSDLSRMVQEMLKTMRNFILIMQLFGAALAFAMLFNMVTINVLERQSEVATLRTIGTSRREISRMVITENMIVCVMGILLGIPVSRWFVGFFWQVAQTQEQQDLVTFKIQISTTTMTSATAAILVVAMLSQIPSLLFLSRLDLANATKERST